MRLRVVIHSKCTLSGELNTLLLGPFQYNNYTASIEQASYHSLNDSVTLLLYKPSIEVCVCVRVFRHGRSPQGYFSLFSRTSCNTNSSLGMHAFDILWHSSIMDSGVTYP